MPTPNSSVTNLGQLENGCSSNNLRKDTLQSNTGASTIMHADSYLNIRKITNSNSTPTKHAGKFENGLITIHSKYI